MAPSRGKGKARAAPTRSAAAGPSRRSTRKRKDATPDVYQDMLAEAAVTDPETLSDRPPKRRRVAEGVALPSPPRAKEPEHVEHSNPALATATAGQQTISDSSEDSSDDESDFAFEDVDLSRPTTTTDLTAAEERRSKAAATSITIGGSNTTPRRQAKAKRKGASLAEKAHRLLVHKAHVLCLLGHCMYINGWCNNETVHRNLEAVLNEKTKVLLRAKVKGRESQFDRNAMFMDGLAQAVEQFRLRFRVTSSGMRRARWTTVEGEQAAPEADGEVVDRSDFIRASRKMEGSQDTGNQLFCALLRSIGVEARVVCSLQVVLFGNAPAPKGTPIKPVKRTIYASDAVTNSDRSAGESSADDMSVRSSTGIGGVPPARRRLGQPSFASASAPSAAAAATPASQRKGHVRKLAYPVFWVEAFNTAYQKWIPVDPTVTGTHNKPAKLEPPSSYEPNQLSYVVAFEADGVARDVTRRYAKAYNAKTRRLRVESTENGFTWLKKALRLFRRRGPALDRDQVEDAELAQKEAREGLPGNVQDFKDHPYYALERHLRRHEVIHPKREVGKVNAGTAAKPRMEAVFRRQDVLVCRSGDKWYRLGREVKAGEQAVKHVASRRVARRAEDGEEDEERGLTALYSLQQTEVYVPPPVVQGKVPRNGFGNLDVYVPSMVPAGGVHIRHPMTREAARELGVDAVDAVTGFTFKGRQGTAVIEGAVVAEQHADAVREVIEGLGMAAEEERCRQRSLVALTLWARMLKALRISERVEGYASTADRAGQRDHDADEADEAAAVGMRAHADEETPLLTAGRYTLEELAAGIKKGGKRKRKVESEGEDEDDGGGFEADEGDEADSDLPRRRSTRSRRKVVADEGSGIEGGGEEQAGGFDPDETADVAEPTAPTRLSTRSRRKIVDDDENDHTLMPNAEQSESEGGGFIAEDTTETPGGGSVAQAVVSNGDDAGGFMPEDPNGDEGGGKFLVEDADDNHAAPPQRDLHDGDDEGGGFLADAEDDSEGGFLPDLHEAGNDDQFHDAALGTTLPSIESVATKTASTLERELRDHHRATLLARDGPKAKSATHEPSIVTSHDGQADATNIEAARGAPVTSEHELTKSSATTELSGTPSRAPSTVDEDEAGQDSDQGSLLSHDPEDDDAEPDWLESD